MKPYYEDDLVTLYHGDCLEVTEWLAADVLVTDPPYGMSYVSGWTKDRADRPIRGDGGTTARDRMLKRWGDRPAIVFGTWRVPKPEGVKQTGIWDKGDDPGMGDLSMLLRANKPPVNNRPDHPTPKPTGLMEILIEKCPPGMVADPFAGSGATLIAARNLGRRVIGVEIEERYCEMIVSRLAQQAFDFEGLSA